MARKLSIALAVVLAIFAGLRSLGHAQVRGGGFHGGGFRSDGWGWGSRLGLGFRLGLDLGVGLGLAMTA